LAYQEGTLLLL